MDIESHESALLLKESSPRKRQGLALKLAVVLCGLALLVNLNGPTDTNIGVTFSSNKEEKKATATAAAGVSTSRPASTMSMDWRVAAVAAPAWSVEDNDTTRAPFGYCARGGGFRMMSMHRGSGHRSRERREVGFLGNIREARGVAGRRRGTDHRSVARGRAPFDVVSLSIDYVAFHFPSID